MITTKSNDAAGGSQKNFNSQNMSKEVINEQDS